jgi:hypothetical protein
MTLEIFSVLKYTFKSFYENLFKLVLLGITWFIISFFLLLIALFAVSTGWFIMLIIPLMFLGPLFLTAIYGCNQLLEYQEFSIKVLFGHFKNNFWRGFFVFFISIIIYAVFIIDFRFFLLKGQENLWLLAFAFLFAYLLIYFTIYQAYLWALLVIQENKSLKDIFKNALIISLDNIIFSLFWFLFILLITTFLAVIGIGIPAAFVGIIGILILKGSKEMLAKY